MAYWWVNHKQTFLNETDGGYIWSPKENRNGSRNQTYINLTLTQPGDIIFSYASGKIRAIGIVSSRCREQSKPFEFGKAGGAWSDLGWMVPINWAILSAPIIPKEYIDSISKLLPQKNSPLQPNGNGNQACYLASIPDNLGLLLINLAKTGNYDSILAIEAEKSEIEELDIEKSLLNEDIEPTEKDQLIKARKGQGKFRKNVEKMETCCRVTGVGMKNLLIASHIKPWRSSSNLERLDGNNGLLLAPHIDRLFDQGWISFQSNGDLIFASDDIKEILKCWGVLIPKNVGVFNTQQEYFMYFHRENIFKD